MLMGLGNGAVFKLVPQYFPRETGTVTGLVGAMGGLGGFFPPLLLGICRDRLVTFPLKIPRASPLFSSVQRVAGC
jgi:MFS transporter, NNP family, nitrate/nitrite transporter